MPMLASAINIMGQNRWLQRANFTGINRDDGVGFTINGKGFAGTGRLINFSYSRDFWQYDPQSDS